VARTKRTSRGGSKRGKFKRGKNKKGLGHRTKGITKRLKKRGL
jgi:hypothetical protein